MAWSRWPWRPIVGTLGLYNALLAVAAFLHGSAVYGGVFGALATACMGLVQLVDIYREIDEAS